MSSQDGANHTANGPATRVEGGRPLGTAAAPVALDHVGATDNIRGSAKWVVAASASMAAILVAGLRLSELASLPGNLLKVEAAFLFLAAFACAGIVLVRAALVLVLRPITLSNLSKLEREALEARQVAIAEETSTGAITEEQLELDLDLDAELPGSEHPKLPQTDSGAVDSTSAIPFRKSLASFARVICGPEDTPLAYVESYREVLNAVSVRSSTDLLLLYSGHKPHVLDGKPMPWRESIETSVQQLVTFVELQRVVHRFQNLTRGLGLCGSAFAISILLFALIAGAGRPSKPIRVTQPIPVSILFTGNGKILGSQGLASCSGQRLNGTAVGGEIRSPEVILEPSKNCPGGRKKITPEIGIVVYKDSVEINQESNQEVNVIEPSDPSYGRSDP